MPQTTPDDHGDDPGAAPPHATPRAPGHPAKKTHPPRLDQHGEAGAEDTPTDPADDDGHGKNPETSTSDEGA